MPLGSHLGPLLLIFILTMSYLVYVIIIPFGSLLLLVPTLRNYLPNIQGAFEDISVNGVKINNIRYVDDTVTLANTFGDM